jgi:hypothetical protein
LIEAIESGKYFELYEKWFGPKGEVPYPLTAENKRFLILQGCRSRNRRRVTLPVRLERA